MKITLNPQEVLEFKKIMKTISDNTNKLKKTLGEEACPEVSLVDRISGCKFANVQIGITGMVINVDPTFVKESCYVYTQYYATTMNHMISLVKSFMEMDIRAEIIMDKWF